ncbi:hypothetical protein DL93DRAFT_1689344 [Clavulina sp. PMI_390]|nr:hypothetical protein DL93DRAFT_1689344 [Clavulina sp. PMI_390]
MVPDWPRQCMVHLRSAEAFASIEPFWTSGFSGGCIGPVVFSHIRTLIPKNSQEEELQPIQLFPFALPHPHDLNVKLLFRKSPSYSQSSALSVESSLRT